MNKKQWSLVILSVFLTILMLFNLGCAGSSPEEEKVMEEVVEILTEDDSEDSADTSAADEPEKEEVEDTPIPRYSFVETYDYPPMASLDEYTNIIGLTDADKEKLDVRLDIEGNNVWGGGLDVEGVPPSAEPYSDIIFTARGTFDYPPDYTGLPVNGMHTCGYYNYEVPTWVSCPQGLDTTDVSRWHVIYVGFGDTVPISHDTRYGTVALAMILANDPLGIYVPHEEYPQDHFGGANVRLINRSAPGEDWESNAYDSDWNLLDVDFFTAFYKNIAAFYVSAADVELEYPFGRPTCDWADPNDYQNSFSGDTEFGDATIPPTQWQASSHIVYNSATRNDGKLPEGYSLCSYGNCFMNYGDSLPREGNNFVSCECSGCTNQTGCDCALFTNNVYKTIDLWFTDPKLELEQWEHVADANQKTLLNPAIHYSCFCVSK